MNIIELAFLILALCISGLFGTYFVRHLGWFGVLPAGILGFGLVGLLLLILNKLFLPRRSDQSGQSDDSGFKS